MKALARFFLSLVVLVLFALHAANCAGSALVPAFLTRNIPPRSSTAMTGTEFAKYVAAMDRPEREEAIVSELLSGNLPDFLRRLKPVRFVRTLDGKSATATIFTMPDYLAIGSETDYLLIPMNLRSALAVAVKFGFVLPTPKIVDAVFEQSDVHLNPQPLPACSQMRSTEYYVAHDRKIKEQRRILDVPPDALVSGHKKDVVIADRMARTRERVAIYGWHRPSGVPIQPLSTAHNARYADYSHGVRLVSDTVMIDNEPVSIYQALQDPRFACLLGGEGIMTVFPRFFPLPHAKTAGITPGTADSRFP